MSGPIHENVSFAKKPAFASALAWRVGGIEGAARHRNGLILLCVLHGVHFPADGAPVAFSTSSRCEVVMLLLLVPSGLSASPSLSVLSSLNWATIAVAEYFFAIA